MRQKFQKSCKTGVGQGRYKQIKKVNPTIQKPDYKTWVKTMQATETIRLGKIRKQRHLRVFTLHLKPGN